jgi:hypothetical protein
MRPSAGPESVDGTRALICGFSWAVLVGLWKMGTTLPE